MLDLEAQDVTRTVRATVPLKDLQDDSCEVVLVQDLACVTLVAMRDDEDVLWRNPLRLCQPIELRSLHHTIFLQSVPQVAVVQSHSMVTSLEVSHGASKSELSLLHNL